jgi:hypothetical protein
MKGLAQRTIASMAILATLTLATPALAVADTTTTTTTTTTTVITKTPVITTMKEWHAADKLYLLRLKVINLTFLSAVATAKMTLSTSLSGAQNSGQRISARATYRFAITEATIARSNALTQLGPPPPKPGHKFPAATTTP